ncbi:MAG: hypothetical protein HY814_11025 [Candidatus Riflebacteria bacterium]|nr:hypothetical protein [Candidatus Riflebacteria bacterium]
MSVSIRPAAKPKIQAEVNLVATVDRTGSTQRFAQGVKDCLPLILKPIEKKAAKVAVSLHSHGDLDEGQAPILLTDRGSVDQAILDVATIVFGGGGDPPENHLDQIEHLMHSSMWLSDPRRGHDALLLICTADSKPARSGKSARELGEELRQRRIQLYAICEMTPVLHELVTAAGGCIFPISNNPDTAEMARIAADVARSITQTAETGAPTLPRVGAPTAGPAK